MNDSLEMFDKMIENLDQFMDSVTTNILQRNERTKETKRRSSRTATPMCKIKVTSVDV